MNDSTNLPEEKWYCFGENSKLLQTRVDLGQLFKWISEEITKKEMDVL